MRYDPFFLLDGPVTRIFRLKEGSTTLKPVMSMTYSCSSSERSPRKPCKKGVTRAGGAVPQRYIPSPDGDVYLGLTSRGLCLGP